MSDYRDLGFNTFLIRSQQFDPNQVPQQLDPSQFDFFTDQISADKIQGGLMQSTDGKTKLDLEQGTFTISNNIINLITLGKLPDGRIGLLIQDQDGNLLMQISDGLNIIQSSSTNFQVDFDNKRLLFKDSSGNPQGVLGEI